jgi:hypothetical protein
MEKAQPKAAAPVHFIDFLSVAAYDVGRRDLTRQARRGGLDHCFSFLA